MEHHAWANRLTPLRAINKPSYTNCCWTLAMRLTLDWYVWTSLGLRHCENLSKSCPPAKINSELLLLCIFTDVRICWGRGRRRRKSDCRVIETDETSLDYLGQGRGGLDCQKTRIVMWCVRVFARETANTCDGEKERGNCTTDGTKQRGREREIVFLCVRESKWVTPPKFWFICSVTSGLGEGESVFCADIRIWLKIMFGACECVLERVLAC